MPSEARPHHTYEIKVARPKVKDVTLTQQFVCQIESRKHVKVCALVTGHLEEIFVKEGQAVKEGDVMFKVSPIPHYEKAHTAAAEATPAQLAEAELTLATTKAPFDGVIERMQHQQGNMVHVGDILTTLSDTDTMRVDFDVPEASYLDYMADRSKKDPQVELKLANGDVFPHAGKIVAIAGAFNTETGNITFHADFPNPDHLLRNGQAGIVLIRRVLNDAVVIPQRATFEFLQKRYVYVVDKDDIAHQREIVVQNELEDIFVVKQGVGVDDKIILDGIRRIRDGDKVKYAAN
jgi:membrane fusion protein (multidrug efflux system)